jgi:hypothetical protein
MQKIYSPTSLLSAAFFLLAALSSSAQDEGFIYGKIYLDDDRTYEGPIRWGKEEVYWVDVFNAAKEENDYIHYLSNEERERLDERRTWDDGDFSASTTMRWLGISSSQHDYKSDYTHQFSCQFGEIKSIRLLSSKRVEVELQSGIKAKVHGEGYNDIGTDVRIIDKEIGEIEVNWNRIEKVEFKNTPPRLAQKFGEPLYGTIETFQGTFTGYVQWDHDERLTTDKLDGDSEDGKVAITFDKIVSLEPHMSRCSIVLKSGRTLDLRGSNDVNSENRGIIVTNEAGTILDVPWRECKKLTLKPISSAPAIRYENFKSQKELNTVVVTLDGKKISGKTVIDLDEEYDFELFQGKVDEIEFSVPLRNIKHIAVINGYRADVTLTSGTKLELGDSQDAGKLNQGILVFVDKDRPTYIDWKDVKEIELH